MSPDRPVMNNSVARDDIGMFFIIYVSQDLFEPDSAPFPNSKTTGSSRFKGAEGNPMQVIGDVRSSDRYGDDDGDDEDERDHCQDEPLPRS